MLRLHPESVRPRQLAAPLFVAGLVIGLPLALASPLLGVLYAVGLGSYAGLSLLFARLASRRAPNAGVGRIMLAFLTIHLAWGLGFWRELLRSGPM